MKPNATEDGPVPLFGTWRRAYAVVVVVLVVNVSVLYLLTRCAG